jgi:hypothetical protein
MKIEFLPYQKKVGMKYITRPQTDEEMRMLTIWRDLALGRSVYLKVQAAEILETNKPGLPNKPVTALCLVPVVLDENGKEIPYLPQENEAVHPLQFVPTHNVGVSSGRKTRVIPQPTGRDIEEADLT